MQSIMKFLEEEKESQRKWQEKMAAEKAKNKQVAARPAAVEGWSFVKKV